MPGLPVNRAADGRHDQRGLPELLLGGRGIIGDSQAVAVGTQLHRVEFGDRPVFLDRQHPCRTHPIDIDALRIFTGRALLFGIFSALLPSG
jgi:hypothetical protein